MYGYFTASDQQNFSGHPVWPTVTSKYTKLASEYTLSPTPGVKS
jgi:hypothetical protein